MVVVCTVDFNATQYLEGKGDRREGMVVKVVWVLWKDKHI